MIGFGVGYKFKMKQIVEDMLKSCDHEETVKVLEQLNKEIKEKEDSLKDFLKRENTSIIDNTIKIKNVYGGVEKIKLNLEEIIHHYGELLKDLKNKNSFYTSKENQERQSEKDSELISEICERTEIENLWIRKYERYQFLFRHQLDHYECADIVQLNKEELKYHNFFYLNTHINNLYLDINKKVNEENYVTVLNRIYTEVFFHLKVFQSMIKNATLQKKVERLVVRNTTESQNTLYLDSVVQNQRDKFISVLMKIWHSSLYNVTRKVQCRIKTVVTSLMVLLLFYNKQNEALLDIPINGFFEEIMNARRSIMEESLLKKEDSKHRSFERMKDKIEQELSLVLNSKYIFWILWNIEGGTRENETTLERKNPSSISSCRFIEKMKSELFMLQKELESKESYMEKSKNYFHMKVNSITDIQHILKDKDKSIPDFQILYEYHVEDVQKMGKYMIEIVQEFYNKTYDMDKEFFLEYSKIHSFYNEIKESIQKKENYFHSFINDMNPITNDNLVQDMMDRVFDVCLFFFFNKSLTALPFFDTKPIIPWKDLISYLLNQLFLSSSITSYDSIALQINKSVMYSFLLNVFYCFYELNNAELNSLPPEFLRVEYSSKKCEIYEEVKGIEDYKKKMKHQLVHVEFKNLIKRKIIPLFYTLYKFLTFIEHKEIKLNNKSVYPEKGNTSTETSAFDKTFQNFIYLLKDPSVNIQGEANPPNEEKIQFFHKFMQSMLIQNETEPSEEKKNKKSSNNELRELNFYVHLNTFNSKIKFSHFMNRFAMELEQNHDQAVNTFDSSEYFKIENSNVTSLRDEYKEEPNFSFSDLRCLFFRMAYKIMKIGFACFCLDYFTNVEKYLDSMLTSLIDGTVKNITCEEINPHLLNIFIFANLFITYIQRIIQSEEYQGLLVFMMKILLQKKILYIYRTFFNKVKEVHKKELQKHQETLGVRWNKKVTQIYNILLLDICFCEVVLDRNTIVSKSVYEKMILRYKNLRRYYIHACYYFVNIYREKYNIYSERNISLNQIKKHRLFTKLGEPVNDGNILDTLKKLQEDVLYELNTLDTLCNLIFQKHIKKIAREQVRSCYVLFYLFVEGSTINNLLKEEKDNSLQELSEQNVEIFNFVQVEKMTNSSFIEPYIMNMLS